MTFNSILLSALKQLPNKQVLVVGDLILDKYWISDVIRISPEAPVPVAKFLEEIEVLGGAANVAANLRNLGLKVITAGYVGQDQNGENLISLLEKQDINSQAIVPIIDTPTTTKLRIMSQNQQMLRIDFENKVHPVLSSRIILENAIEQIFAEYDLTCIILSDYDKGVLVPELCQMIIIRANERNIPVFVDPKNEGQKYKGATGIFPNIYELQKLTQTQAESHTSVILSLAKQLRSELDLDFVTVTCGKDGLLFVNADVEIHFSTTAREVYDVSGAGDTITAVVSALLSSNVPFYPAHVIANFAAGIVIGYPMTKPVDRESLVRWFGASKLDFRNKRVELDAVIQHVNYWRSIGETIVFTNGCFDMLHAGHLVFLEKAKQLGSRLIVGLNEDESVTRLKGAKRPIVNQSERALALSALEFVDLVVFFSEDTPLKLIQAIKPDVLVKGKDYIKDEIIGASEVTQWGGIVKRIELLSDKSTTKLIEKIVNSIQPAK